MMSNNITNDEADSKLTLEALQQAYNEQVKF